jgi:dihydroorotase-like cyclic amidohydrolase
MDVIGSCEVMPSIHYASKIFDVERKEWFEVGNKPGTAEDYEKLWQAINDGTIDFLATDHAPQKREAYTLDDPTKSHLGAPMIEWYGHLLLDEVNKGHLSLKRLVEVTSESAAKVFGFYPRKGAILPGSDADLIICDLKREWTITSKRVYTRVQLNPYHGREVKGKITHTILRGAVIMEEGEVKGKPGYGRFIKPSGR